MTRAAETKPSGFTAAHQRLRNAQKTSRGVPAYLLYINRPLGRVLAAAAYQVKLTPNQVTYLSAVSTFAGIILLALLPPRLWVGFLVCAALVLGHALDSADGQLARLRGGGSLVGEWLDHTIDAAKLSSLHLAVLITAQRHFDLPPGWLLVPIAFNVVAAVHFFGMILVDHLVQIHRLSSKIAPPPPVAANRLLTLLKTPIDYGVLCLSFLLLGMPLVFFGVYTVLALGWTGYLVLALRKWHSDIVGLTQAAR